jgi:indole-3-glycerol phosphate synthase
LCKTLKLDALVEVYSESDLETASRAGAKLIGINNRNLSSFDTDISHAVNLMSLIMPDQVPVAASGIQSKDDIHRITESGIHNFLIGESLVRAKNPLNFLKTLYHNE